MFYMIVSFSPPEYASSVDPSAFDEFAYKYDDLHDRDELSVYRDELLTDVARLTEPVLTALNEKRTLGEVAFDGYQLKRNHNVRLGSYFESLASVWHVDRRPTDVAVAIIIVDLSSTDTLSGVVETTDHDCLKDAILNVDELTEDECYYQRLRVLQKLGSKSDVELTRNFNLTIKPSAPNYSALIVPSDLAHRSCRNKTRTSVTRHSLLPKFVAVK